MRHLRLSSIHQGIPESLRVASGLQGLLVSDSPVLVLIHNLMMRMRRIGNQLLTFLLRTKL